MLFLVKKNIGFPMPLKYNCLSKIFVSYNLKSLASLT